MVGVTHTYIHKKDDPCYIVIRDQEGNHEFLEARFQGYHPEGHPAWEEFRKKGLPASALPAQAIVNDPNGFGRAPEDPITFGKEPCRHYAIISRREYDRIVQQNLDEMSSYVQEATDLTFNLATLLTKTLKDNRHLRNKKSIMKDYVKKVERRADKVRWDYLGIGIAFGLAAALGFAAYQNYREVSQLPEVKTLEVRVEQP